MKIIGYVFEADTFCVGCTQKAVTRMKLDHSHPYAMGESHKDDNGIEYDIVDSEGSLLRPIFSTDEQYQPSYCGACRESLV